MTDHNETQQLENRLRNSVKALHEMAPAVGAAKQVIEFSSDQRKNILAAEQMRYINRGESVAGSETMARTSPIYLEKLKQHEEASRNAHATVASWQATMAAYESNRSLLAMTRETLKTLDG